MKLNKPMKTLAEAMLEIATEPLRKHIADLEAKLAAEAETRSVAEERANLLNISCNNLHKECDDLKTKKAELSSELSKAEMDLSLAVEARDAAEDRVKNLNENFKDLMSSHDRLSAEYDKLQQSKLTFENSWANLYEGEPKFDVNKPNRQVLVRSRGKNAEWHYQLCSHVSLKNLEEKNFEHQWCYLE